MSIRGILAFFGIYTPADKLSEALKIAMRETCSQMAREFEKRSRR